MRPRYHRCTPVRGNKSTCRPLPSFTHNFLPSSRINHREAGSLSKLLRHSFCQICNLGGGFREQVSRKYFPLCDVSFLFSILLNFGSVNEQGSSSLYLDFYSYIILLFFSSFRFSWIHHILEKFSNFYKKFRIIWKNV